MKPHITQAELKRILYYRRDTGEFFWRFGTKNRLPWRKAGTLTAAGYIALNINGRNYYAHRLAMLYETGAVAPIHTDHDDGDRANNRPTNLIAKTASGNGQNRKRANKNNSRGTLGITKRFNRFRARIMVNRKEVFLGSFCTEQEAIEAHRKAKLALT